MAIASIGKKILMAITGLIAFGFVLGHMLGNLQVFAGQEQINAYAAGLKALGPLLWVGRTALLVFFVTHIYLGIKLKAENLTSRAGGYQKEDTIKASFSSRTMMYSGVLILIFFVYHILHFTAHITDPSYKTMFDSLGRPDVYNMVITGFSNTPIAIWYMFTMALLGMHVSHGISSVLQTFGLNSVNARPKVIGFANVIALILTLGFIAVPLAVITGMIGN